MKSRLADSTRCSFLYMDLRRRILAYTFLAVIVTAAAGAQSAPVASPAAGRAQNARGFSYGSVTLVNYVHVYYGHFEEYMAWVTSTWLPTMEAAKKAGLIIDYKVFQADPKNPDEPNLFLEITFKNFAAYAGDLGDKTDEFEAVTEKVICSLECQNQARVHRNELRKVLGNEVIREIIFK